MTKADDLYERALKLTARLDQSFMDLARVIRDLNDNDVEAFDQFVKTSGLGRRKAYYLIAIDKAFRKLNVSRDRLHKIGWTKVNILSNYVEEDNVNKLLDLAETCTVKELTSRLEGDDAKPATSPVLFYFTEKDRDYLLRALLKFGAGQSSRGLVGKEQALIKIIKKATQ